MSWFHASKAAVGARNHASAAEIVACFRDHTKLLDSLAFFITADRATAEQAVAEAGETTLHGDRPFREIKPIRQVRAGSPEDLIRRAVEHITDENLRATLFDVLVLLNGGAIEEAENRALLHPTCHQQIHSQGSTVTKPPPPTKKGV